MGIHVLHVIGWDGGRTDFKLHCHSPRVSPCFADIDESGVEIGRRESCNLVEWFENTGEEMIDGELRGSPPWRVYADWGNGDYPVLTPHAGSEESTSGLGSMAEGDGG